LVNFINQNQLFHLSFLQYCLRVDRSTEDRLLRSESFPKWFLMSTFDLLLQSLHCYAVTFLWTQWNLNVLTTFCMVQVL